MTRGYTETLMQQATSRLNLFGSLTDYPTDPVMAARVLWSRGFKVVPFKINGHEKRPAVVSWKPYTLGWSEIEAMVSKTQAFGIVVPSGTLVIDLDCEAGENEYCKFIGLDNLIDISAQYGDDRLDFLNTITTDTPTGGMHLWYRVPPHLKFKNSASALAKGVDVRVSEKGLILMPPSIGRNGRRYQFNQYSGSVDAAKAPAWLIRAVANITFREDNLRSVPRDVLLLDSPEKVKQFLAKCSTDIATAPSGARNNTLNAVAYAVYRRVAGGKISEQLADSVLESAALQCWLPEREIVATLHSAKRAASNHPA